MAIPVIQDIAELAKIKPLNEPLVVFRPPTPFASGLGKAPYCLQVVLMYVGQVTSAVPAAPFRLFVTPAKVGGVTPVTIPPGWVVLSGVGGGGFVPFNTPA